MKHYGVIDIGSNTIRLVIYKWEEPELTALLNKKESAGLANYVDRDGGLSEAGICRAEQALAEFREILEHVEVERTYVFATASLRNISNTGIVVERLRRSSGFDIQVISGEEEADYDFRGALRATGLEDGLLVDVGGGTTGISVLKDGKVIFTGDEPTGGTHMTLVLAGFHGWNTQEAELAKRDPAQEANVFPVIKPVVEKMASIVRNYLREYPVEAVYVVGGACCFTQFESVFEKFLGVPVVKPAAPLLVTPLGIAVNCKL